MPIEFRCTECNRLLRTADGTEGRQAKCPECGQILTIPAPEATSPGTRPGPAGEGGSPFGPTPPPADLPSPFAPGIPPPPPPGQRENPYASPTDYGAFASRPPFSPAQLRAEAQDRVSAPAIALIVTGAIGLAIQALGTLGHALSLSIPGMRQDPEMMIVPAEAGVVLGMVGMIVAVLIIVGGVKMKNLRSYGLSMTSAIIAMIPCISPCCLLGLPIGIWALVVLSDSRVQNAFSS
jgi:phage FluMu protein Com